jgi:hypothetical protein
MGTLNATILQKLEGQIRPLGGTDFRFVESDNGKPATWAGGEGFAVPVDVRSDGRYILKIFKLPTPERRRRALFLSMLSLGSLRSLPLPLFAAAPSWAVQGTLSVPDEGEFDVSGHLARFIHGRSFEELLMKGWDPPIDVRARLARQLCLAIEVLEGAGQLVHGDLSAANVMIVDAEGTAPKLCLIDFDGFYHPQVPPVPVSPNRSGGRSWGTPGYRAPAFRKGTEALVDSDRVAMAILALELVALRPVDAGDLPGDTLLSQEDIDALSPRIPDGIAARWPEGWELVQEAIAADVAARAPAPNVWRRALDRLEKRSHAPVSERAASAAAPPFVVFVRQWGHEDRQLRLHRPGGTFQLVSPELRWLSYMLKGDYFELSGRLPLRPGSSRGEPLLVRHGGIHADWTRYDGGDIIATARFGDVVHWGDCDIYLG